MTNNERPVATGRTMKEMKELKESPAARLATARARLSRSELGAFTRHARDLAAPLDIPSRSAALSFQVLLSAVPLLILTVSLSAILIGADRVKLVISDGLRTLLGATPTGGALWNTWIGLAREQLVALAAPPSAVPAFIVGFLALLWGASRVFDELQRSMNAIMGRRSVPARHGRLWSTLTRHLLSFAFVLAISIGFFAIVLFAPLVAAVGDVLSMLAPEAVDATRSTQLLLTFSVLTVALMAVYTLLPEADIHWRDVWPAAVVCAAMLTLGIVLVGLYFRLASRYLFITAVTSPLVGLYMLRYVVLLVYGGALVSRVYAERYGSWRGVAD